MSGQPSPARAFALGRLPSSEFAVQMHDHAEAVLTAADDGGVVGTATVVRTSKALSGAPVTVAVVCPDATVAARLASRLADHLPSEEAIELLGPSTAAADVADALAGLVDGLAEPVMRQRLWSCTRPVPPRGVPGAARPMGIADLEVVAAWLDEFSVEALHLPTRGRDEWLRELAEVSGMMLWHVHGRPVSMAMGRRTTPCSARIGPVYTPPDERGHGYAAALTAALTRRLLATGLERVVLLTDVTNPTSNRLYARVGYEQVDTHESWVVRR